MADLGPTLFALAIYLLLKVILTVQIKRKVPAGVLGITYTAVDCTGYIHARFAKFHTQPIYLWAVVRNPGCNEIGCCSFQADERRAKRELNRALAAKYDVYSAELLDDPTLVGKPMYPQARIERVTWRVGEPEG